MKIIQRIVIKRFRSFSTADIDCDEITIFSGTNNQGKSNVLKALNLFFNHEYGAKYDYDIDYSKAFLGDASGRRISSIRVYFYGAGGNGALEKDGFSIERIYGENNIYETKYYEPESETDIKDGNIRRQFTLFLNKIQFIYIPAIRDKSFVGHLFSHFRDLIDVDAGKSGDFKDGIQKASGTLTEISKEVGKELQGFIGLPTIAQVDLDNASLLASLDVKVKTGLQYRSKKRETRGGKIIDIDVSLFSSGDGILMSYVAYFLNYLSTNLKNKKFIWGFEEPENSLEYSIVQKLAKEFKENFRNDAQIFLTTHSPAFVKLNDEPFVKLLRVFILPQDSKDVGKKPYRRISSVMTIDAMRNRQLTLFEKGDTSEEFDTLSRELNFLEFSDDIEGVASKRNNELLGENEGLKNSIKNITKPMLLVEDEYTEIYKVAWLKLHDEKFDNNNLAQVFDDKASFAIVWKGNKDNLKGFLNNPGMDDLGSKKVVGLFDFDDAYNCFSSLKNESGWDAVQGEEETGLYRKRGNNISAMVLPVPSFRKNIASEELTTKRLEIELLFTDDSIKEAYGNESVAEEQITGETKIPKINNKQNFWKKTINLNKSSFAHFEPLFEKCEELLDLKEGKNE